MRVHACALILLTHLLDQRQQQVGQVEVAKVICPNLHLEPVLSPGQGSHHQPIRGQYSGHVTSVDQSEGSIQVT